MAKANHFVSWVPQWTQTYVNLWATVSPAGVTPAITWNPGSNNVLSVGYPGGGVSALLDVASGVRQNVLVPVQSNYGGPFRLSATQGFGEDSVEIAYQIVQGEGSYVLDFTPTTGNVHLNLIRVMGIDDGSLAGITLLSPWRWTLSYTNQNQLVQICPMVKDEYRFGFNGQQKDNEYAGIGNHNTALFWEYDTRLGRRWNLDPVDQVSISNYAALANNPIYNNDVHGDVISPWWLASKAGDKIPGYSGGVASPYKSFLSGEDLNNFTRTAVGLYNSNSIFRKTVAMLQASKAVYSVQQRYETSTNIGANYNSQTKTLEFMYFGASAPELFEETFHAGQDDYYSAKGIKRSSLSDEVEQRQPILFPDSKTHQ